MKSLTIIFVLIAFCGCNFANGNKVKTGVENKKSDEKTVETISITDTIFTFENYIAGKLPSGWTEYYTGNGKPGLWKIVDDNGNKVIMQTSDNYRGYHFNLVVNNELEYKDVEISVRFKAVKGDEDQGGGPVWRFSDAGNYYIARANPLENNFRLYKVVNGRRIQLKSAEFEINTGEWYTLKIVMINNVIECYFNGELKLKTKDNTFEKAGKIGLWTKADAVTMFDDLTLKQR
jgi:hypothetical protein